ncbi:MAG: helix-turn-helix transcriptional regulator [Clostridia bacterium]|nr:helix-turn-helix transcriptional regulator [Clostridia bacterium]
MGKLSTKENKNVYQVAREGLGLSRAAAAEKMSDYGLTEYRLVKIEDGTVKIQPEDVVAMSKGYNEPELRNHYCCHECPIGKIDTPEVIYKDNIHEILVNMAVSLESVNQKKLRLMDMLADGKIEKDEAEDFRKISEELEKISMTIEALQLWCEKMIITE